MHYCDINFIKYHTILHCLWYEEKKKETDKMPPLQLSHSWAKQSISDHKANRVVCVMSPYESGRQTSELSSEFCTVEVLLGLSVFARNSTKVAAFQEFGCTQKYVNAFQTKRTVRNIVYGRFSGVSLGGIPLQRFGQHNYSILECCMLAIDYRTYSTIQYVIIADGTNSFVAFLCVDG